MKFILEAQKLGRKQWNLILQTRILFSWTVGGAHSEAMEVHSESVEAHSVAAVAASGAIEANSGAVKPTS